MKSSVYSIRVPYQLLVAIFSELDENQIAFSNISGALLAKLDMGLDPAYKELSDHEAISMVKERVVLCGQFTKETKNKVQSARLNSTIGLDSLQLKNALKSGGQSYPEENRFNSNSELKDNDFSPLALACLEQEIADEEAKLGFGFAEVMNRGSGILEQEIRQKDLNASDDLEDILQEQIALLEQENSEALLAKLTGGFTVAKAKDLPVTLSKAKTISERDPRLEKDKLWKAFSGEADEGKMFALRIVYYNLPVEYWSSEKAEQMLLQLLENLK